MSKLLLIGGGAAIAIYLVYQRKESFFHKENEEFREGFTAGFFTPSPFYLAALVGILVLK